MIVGFHTKAGGNNGKGRSPIDYLIDEQRDPAPQVVRGNPNQTRALIDTLSFHNKYTFGVLSFAPGELITPAMEQAIIDRFEQAAFAGLEPDQYNILWVRHTHAKHHELHFVVPKVELSTGKALNIAPPGPQNRSLFDTFRSLINEQYGLADPDDPARARVVSLPAYIEKRRAVTERVGQAWDKDDPREAITDYLTQRVAVGEITNRDGVIQALVERGFEITRVGEHYITAKDPASGERWRLKGALYEARFQSVEQLRGTAPSRTGADRNPDAERMRTLEERLERLTQARARYHRERYAGFARAIERADERRPEREQPKLVPGLGEGVRHASEDQPAHDPAMAQAGPDWPEPLARYLARELGPDTALDQPSSGLDQPSAGLGERATAPEHEREGVRGADVGRVASARSSRPLRNSASARRNTGLDLQRQQEPVHQAELEEAPHDRAREAVAQRLAAVGAELQPARERLDALVRGTRHGLEDAAHQLAAASAELEQTSARANHSLQSGRERLARGIAAMRRHQNDELEQFKQDINLSEYAASQGYELSKRESSRSSAVMRHPAGNKIVITRQQDGHWVYFSVHNDADHGSIVDFVQQRSALSLGAVRKELRPWLNATSRPTLAREFARQLDPISRDREGVVAAYSRMQVCTEHPYLTSRGLGPDILGNSRFADCVRVALLGNNPVWPHYDREGLCGYEIKGPEFTGFAKGGEKGLWTSRTETSDTRLVFTESAIDALSYHALHKDPHTRYMSTGGALSYKQRALIQGAIEKMPIGSEIVLAFDRDAAGEKLAQEVAAMDLQGRKLVRPVPTYGKDWNDELRQRQLGRTSEARRGRGISP